MSSETSKAIHILQRIADTLGTEITAFCFDHNNCQIKQDSLELLNIFERIVDRKDRRLCLDFVNSVFQRQQI